MSRIVATLFFAKPSNSEMLKRRFAFAPTFKTAAFTMLFRPAVIVRLVPLVPVALAAAFGLGCVSPPPGLDPTGQTQQRVDVCAVSEEGALCNDGNPCTMTDRCRLGICVGTTPAPDGTSCTGMACTMNNKCMAGVCVGSPAADGYPCISGEPCTDPGSCRAGLCQAGPLKTCNDNNPCTSDTCVLGRGCMSVAIPECAPPDGGDAADVRDAPADESGDTGDVANDPPPVDIPPIDMPPVDMMTMDRPPVDMVSMDIPPAEMPVEMMPIDRDAPVEQPPGDVPPDQTEGRPEAVEAPPDGPEAAPDLVPADLPVADVVDDTGETTPDLRARGGACVCTTPAGGPMPEGWLAGLVMAVAFLGRPRRRPGRGTTTPGG